MSQYTDLLDAVNRLMVSVMANARADSAANMALAKVLSFTGPQTLVGADGTGLYAWPASVEVEIMPGYTRIVENLAHKTEREALLQHTGKGILVSGPGQIVSNVPVLFMGTEEMSLTSAPKIGTYGLLMMTGKHHATCMSNGAPEIPRLGPTTERLSDSVFLPGFLVGNDAMLLPPSSQPAIDTPSQIGPRSAESEVVHLRSIPGGFILGGTDIRLGGATANKPASGVGDKVALAPGVQTFLSAVAAFMGIPSPPDMNFCTITTGNPAVKV